MATFIAKVSDYVEAPDDEELKVLSIEKFNSFDTSLLGLGDITKPSYSVDAIAAFFDLEGFTNFSRQIEPHLSVPVFLSEFLTWLLAHIRAEMTHQKYDVGVALYCPLPFLVKFMGDGLMVLWNVSTSTDVARRNIVLSAFEICEDYKLEFLPKIQKKVVEPPRSLRCGLARGTVFSVGDGNDFVGPCINMAARLQKVPGATFAFNRRGFNLEDPAQSEFFTTGITVKKMSVRGIGDHELIAIIKEEFEKMSDEERGAFSDV